MIKNKRGDVERVKTEIKDQGDQWNDPYKTLKGKG